MYWKVWVDLNAQIMKKAGGCTWFSTLFKAHWYSSGTFPSQTVLQIQTIFSYSSGTIHCVTWEGTWRREKTDSQPHVVELGETAFNCLLHSPKKSFDQYRIFTQEIPQRGSKASEIIDRYFKGFWQNTKFGFLQWHHIQAN